MADTGNTLGQPIPGVSPGLPGTPPDNSVSGETAGSPLVANPDADCYQECVVPTADTIFPETQAVKLSRYAQRIQYPECQFWGINDPSSIINYQCRDIWTKTQRDMIAFYLAEAQEEIENELGYPMSNRWIVGTAGEAHDGTYRFVDEKPYNYSNGQYFKGKKSMYTRWAHVTDAGIKAVTVIDATVAVDYSFEPAVITVATTVTDPKELVIYHPNCEAEITPSLINISGGTATIKIPRCRLVREDMQANPSTGYDVDDLSIYESNVQVIRVYNDTSKQVSFYNPNCTNCGRDTNDGCLYIDNPRFGIVRPDASNSCHCGGRTVGLYYRAGLCNLTKQMEDAIIRLAHSKMPTEPCGCDVVQRMWQRDRDIPTPTTSQRLACPFGINDGAWVAWVFTKRMRIKRLGVM